MEIDGFLSNRTLMTTRKIIVEDGIYHVTQRAPGKEVIFVEEKDYLHFISLLKETTQKFDLEVFCFALLPNHVHILLKIKKANLSQSMKYLFKNYAQWFNKKYERKGHVFCGVYRASFCYDDGYLITASVYIHLNPLKAYLTKDIFRYRWTSINCYVKNSNRATFINNKQILEMLGEDGYSIYKELILSAADLKYGSVLENKNAVCEFKDNFSDFFKDWMKNKNFENSRIINFLKGAVDIENCIDKKKRKNKFTDKKGFLYAVQQLRARGYSFEEIAKRTGINRSTIYRLAKSI